jgi:branched-chain amino acid aminotransferase
MKVWFNGEVIEEESAKISVKTHALHYGTSVFEGIRFYKTKKGIGVFRLKEHIERLFDSADALSMNVPFSRDEVKRAIKELIKVNNVKEGYIRPIIFYGECLSVYPSNVSVNCAILVTNWENNEEGLRVKVSKFRRINEDATVVGAKIGGNYANSVLAMEEARKNGYDEALMLDENNMVCEGPIQNLFIVKDNLLVTPLSKSSLFGITRDTILKIAKGLGFTTIEKDLNLEEVKEADEAFFCGTGAEIIWIRSVDEVGISDKIGKVTKKIKEKYFDIVSGKDKKYESWLDYV